MVKASKSAKVTPHKTRDVLLLLSVPAFIIVAASMLVYIPQVLAKPTYDFIYSYCADYYCNATYSVNDSGRVVNTFDKKKINIYRDDEPGELAYYDVSEDASRNLTLQEAAKYDLDNSTKSPDGYALKQDNSSSGFLFWSDSNDEKWVLEKDALKKPVHGLKDDLYHSSSVRLLGWVKQHEN